MPTSPATQFLLASGQILTPDTCTSMQHEASAETTTHPVEDGSSIADHVIRKPQTLTLTTRWTPRPPEPDYLPLGNHRGQDAFDALVVALQARQPIRIEMDGITYDPVVLTSVTMPRSFDDGDGREIQIQATQIQIVSGQTTRVRVSSRNGFKGKARAKKTNVTLTRAGAAVAATVALLSNRTLTALAYTGIAITR
jgi:hypothetical protein